MELMFEIISRHKFAPGVQASHVFSEVGGIIGRSEACEWCLFDKSKKVSRRHALISCDGRHFFIEDKSSNGIFSPLTKQPIPKGTRHVIEHGESFVIGDYTIQARLLHKPDAYLQPDQMLGGTIIPEDAQLDVDPLVAMEQQDTYIAKQRLGLYNDLLGDTATPDQQPADHSEPRLDTLPSITAIPENWAETPARQEEWSLPAQQPSAPLQNPQNSIAGNAAVSMSVSPKTGLAGLNNVHPQVNSQIPQQMAYQMPQRDPSDEADINMFHPLVFEHPQVAGSPGSGALQNQPYVPGTPQPETDIFFKTLGFESSPETQEERERMLLQAARLIHAFTDGMLEALHNRADTKNELRLSQTTVRMSSDNPFKFSPTASAALEYLLAPHQAGLLDAPEAVKASFNGLHAHHLGLLAGARAAVQGALKAISPENVEARLDADGPVRIRRTARLWHTFTRMHQHMMRDSEGFASFFFNDFTRAYEMQQHTLHPYSKKHIKGDR